MGWRRRLLGCTGRWPTNRPGPFEVDLDGEADRRRGRGSKDPFLPITQALIRSDAVSAWILLAATVAVFGLRLALPEGMNWRHLGGVSALAGIGFTVSIFIAGLAFEDPLANDAAKVGILVASLLAGAVGAAVLFTAGRSRSPVDPAG